MNYRMIGIDLDGTLLDAQNRVSAANLAALAEAQSAGLLIVPCTGRGWREALRPLQSVPDLGLGVFNTGAAVVDVPTGKADDLAEFEPHVVMELIEHLRPLPEAALVYQDHERTGVDYLVTGDGALTDNTLQWFERNALRYRENRRPTLEDLHHSLRVGVVAGGDQAFRVERDVTAVFGERISVHAFAGFPMGDDTDAEPIYIAEIFAAGVDKWRGLQYIARQHGIEPEAIVTIGDEINDLAALSRAGLGIAMANAVPAAKEAAARQTLSNTQDGVAYAIARILDGSW